MFNLTFVIKAVLKSENYYPKKVKLENREQLPVQTGNCSRFCVVF
jgi:hypothetical protein